MENQGILRPSSGAGLKIAAIVLTACLLVFGAGCPSNHSTVENASVLKRITEIRVDGDDKFWYCDIKSDESLSFTAFNQVAPAGLLLYFPNTTLNFEQTILFPPDSEMFKSIEADEIMDGDTKTTRLLIVMQVERPYTFSPDQNGVRISFPKTTHRPADTDNTIHSPAEKNETGAAGKDLTAATVLETVSATALKNHIIISVNADGPIADYKSFAIENPARIVFDIYNLKSPYEKEQIIPVTSEWVMQMRYFAYPDKIRLVLDTKPEFLSQYFSFPTAAGLLIYVGRIPEPLAEKGPTSEAGR